MKFTLKRPCAKCPFRTDIPGYLSKARASSIVTAMTVHQQTFTCHETTVADHDDEESEMMDGPNAQHCAGAMILLERLERPNQLMRLAERFGHYKRGDLDMDAPVFTTPAAFIKAQPR